MRKLGSDWKGWMTMEKSKSRYLFAFVFLLLVSTLGCDKNGTRLDHQVMSCLRRHVDTHSGPEDVTLRIDSCTPFDWDEMYVFSYDCTQDDFFRELKALPSAPDMHLYRWAFALSGRVVHWDEFPVDFEGPTDGELIWGEGQDPVVNVRHLKRKEAVFMFKKMRSNGRAYYQMKLASP